jgi:hypothetical protein
MTRQMRPPPSVPASVNGENCVYLTSPQKPAAVVRLGKDSRPAAERGVNPMSAKRNKIQWA